MAQGRSTPGPRRLQRLPWRAEAVAAEGDSAPPAPGVAAGAGEGGRVTIAAILVAGILLEAWLIARRA